MTTARGHANAFGPVGWVDCRRPAPTWFAHVAAAGGLLSVNHPLVDDCAWQHPSPGTDRFAPPAVELFHISWCADRTATAPWAYLAALCGDPVLLGGSDFHRPDDGWTLGTPTTWVAAEDGSAEAILAGLLAGRTALSLGVGSGAHREPDPFGSPLLLRTPDGLVADRADGATLVDWEGRRRRVTGDRLRVADWGIGPYRLEGPDRGVLCVSR